MNLIISVLTERMATPPQYVVQWQATSAPVESNSEEVRTIFVLGFPSDVKERELQNLLRWWPGYEASQMNMKGDQPMGFALFSTAAMAMAARDALQNLVFDPETNSVLRAEMAKKNLYVKRGVIGNPVESAPVFDPSKRMRTVGDFSSPGFSSPSPAYMQTPPAWAPQSYIASPPPPPVFDPYPGYAVTPVTQVAPAGYPHPVRVSVLNTKDNPPCNTLFIGNLGENTNEAELRGVFASQPGFRQMKVLRQGKNTVCFVEMQDVPSAMNVHSALQGAVLSTSDRGGMRIQYSKNPFGRKRDGYSHNTQNGSGATSVPSTPVLLLEGSTGATPSSVGDIPLPPSVPVPPTISGDLAGGGPLVTG